MKKLLLIFFIVLFSWSNAFADSISSTSGTADHGATITINGSFTAKTQAAPYKFDNFESGTLGNTVTGWETGAGSGTQTYSSTITRGVSGKSAKHDFVNNTTSSLCLNEDANEFTRVYLDFWTYADPEANVSRNYKPWRIWSNDVQLQFYGQEYCSEGDVLEVYDVAHGSSDLYWLSNGGHIMNTWEHHQVEFIESDPSTANGRARQYLDGVLSGGTNVITRWSTRHMDEIRIGHYWAKDAVDGCASNPGAYVYTDDVYVDTTLQRVEIGNASNYTSSTHREIQYPTAWSTGQISVTFNMGSFTEGTQVYLFVIDASGAPSSGYPITVGESGGTPTVTCYPDVDGDLYPGSGSETVETCSTNYYESSHFTAMTTDCNDTNSAVNPGATDSSCDGVDQDCSGSDNCPGVTGEFIFSGTWQ